MIKKGQRYKALYFGLGSEYSIYILATPRSRSGAKLVVYEFEDGDILHYRVISAGDFKEQIKRGFIWKKI